VLELRGGAAVGAASGGAAGSVIRDTASVLCVVSSGFSVLSPAATSYSPKACRPRTATSTIAMRHAVAGRNGWPRKVSGIEGERAVEEVESGKRGPGR